MYKYTTDTYADIDEVMKIEDPSALFGWLDGIK